METLQSRLTWARTKAEISQQVLSEVAGLSSRLVGMIERGTRPNPELSTISKIADVLGVKVGWLASGEGGAPRVTALAAAGVQAQAKHDAGKKQAKGAA